MNAQATLVTPFRPGIDDDDVLALRAAVWGADHPHTSPAFYRWQFGPGNPAGPGSGAVLRRGGRILAFAGVVARAAVHDGAPVTIAQGLDFMAHPSLSAAASARFALRALSVWADLASAQGAAVGYCYPNARSRRLLASRHTDWQAAGALHLMVRPLTVAGAASGAASGVRALGWAFAAQGARALAALRRPTVEGVGRPINLSTPDDAAAVDRFWRKVVPRRGTALVHDAQTLRWRYLDHPLYRYRIDAWVASGEVRALAVTSPRRVEGRDCLLVVALLAPDPAAGARLVDQVVAASGTTVAVAQVGPGDSQTRALRRAGFVTVPDRWNPKPFVQHLIALGAPLPDSPWHVTWGDMDVV